MSADGGIPLHARVFGGAAEVSQVVGAMKDLRTMAGERDFLMVADSKLVSYSNVSALLAAGVHFIAPAPAAQVKDEVYAALDLAQATVVDWTPDRERASPPGSARPTACWRTPTPLTGPARAIRRSPSGGSWSTPPRTPPASKPPGTNAWPRPQRT
ncbi:hypothetical protein StrepF001_12590 [Streptomyces sp. F001]|uniref:hypothetical protein n=1 Tax=Streptomyces sp. F001 TaxID=1510026 RepID=UPI00101E7E88|nr:hypothetical protein [Streptomyces sp. F001]RZB19576.1 hypothetical protein StrepF001_12590 [Streptomyces sp. F001]